MLRKYQNPSPAGAGGQDSLSRLSAGGHSPSCSSKPPRGPQQCFEGHPRTAGMSQEQEGREEHYSPAASLDLCMGVAGSLTAIPFISGFLCLFEELYQLCHITRNTENWARNAKITRIPNPNFIPFLHIFKVHLQEHTYL